MSTEFSIRDLLPILLVRSLEGGEGANMDALLEAMVEQQIFEKLVSQMLNQIPADYRDVVQTMLELAQMESMLAALRGEKPKFDVGKVLEMVIMIQAISKLGGSSGGTGGTA